MSGSMKSNKVVDAAFSFLEYHFIKSSIDFSTLGKGEELVIDFLPSGDFEESTAKFKIDLIFKAISEKSQSTIIDVHCQAMFGFRNNLLFEEIPLYFYANSLAIIYPYIRAFVSTLTLQANYPPFVLPTYNVSDLAKYFKNNSKKH